MITPEEFTKEISPTDIGIRFELEKIGLLKHVHEWMKRYARATNHTHTTTKFRSFGKLQCDICEEFY